MSLVFLGGIRGYDWKIIIILVRLPVRTFSSLESKFFADFNDKSGFYHWYLDGTLGTQV